MSWEMKTNISLLIFFLFACTQLQGQYRFISMGTGDGLPHEKIISIRQDASGFIWIGTRDGIARYDGRDLKVIRPEQAQETSRVDNHIVSIFPSRNGDTWFSTFKPGIYRYSLAEDKIEYFPIMLEGKSGPGTGSFPWMRIPVGSCGWEPLAKC